MRSPHPIHWLDYAALRAQIPIRRVLDELDFEPLIVRGDQWRGVCPLHDSSSRQPCFSVHLTKNVFRCFHCQAAGNQLDLWAAATQTTLYRATLDLCARLSIDPALAFRDPQPRNSSL